MSADINSCLGKNLSLQDIENYWLVNDCLTTLVNFVNQGDNNQYIYNPGNQQVIASAINNIFNLLEPDLASRTPFLNKLYSACINPSLPGICDEYLSKACSNYSRSQVANNKFLNDFCGCYTTPDNLFLRYITGTSGCIDGNSPCSFCTGTGCTGVPSCDPLCRKATVVQKANSENGNLITCNLNVCAIDGNILNISGDSNVSEVIFTNTCSGCSENGNCICIINSQNLNNLSVSLGVGVDLFNFCGEQSICINNGVQEPCKLQPSNLQVLFSFRILWGIVILLGILLVIGIVILIYYRRLSKIRN
jgi:hypothetical protein